MTRQVITCEEFEAIIAHRDLIVVGSCTDIDAEFHSAPQIDTTWGEREGFKEIVHGVRYPRWMHEREEGKYGDREPCEHWIVDEPEED